MWTNPLYSRDAVDQRHGRYKPRFSTIEPRHGMVPSIKKPVERLDLSAPCWTGECPKCGRTLISATTDVWTARDRYTCFKNRDCSA